MDASEEAPINLCLVCGGELRRSRNGKGWTCRECHFFWPDEMFDATIQCAEKPGTMK